MRLHYIATGLFVLTCCTPTEGSDDDPTPVTISPTITAGSAGTQGSDSGSTSEPTTASPTSTDPTTTGVDSDDSGGFPQDSSSGEPPPPPPFDDGHVFVVGFNDRMVFEFDPNLEPVTSWSDPSFDVAEGPAGMVFDYRGYLVVAAYDQFCIFSAPNELEQCFPKITPQRTENVIFDISRNLYTTTSTGGTDEIHKYDEDYNHIATFDLPTGNLTGITCDPIGDLFVASQTGAVSTIYKVDGNALSVLDTFTVTGNAEGLQYGPEGNLLVALSGGVGISRVTPSSPSMLIDTISHPDLLWPVPLTLDKMDNRYTGDFEDGVGAAPADLFVFAPDGTVVASRQPSELHGPFGLVVAGVALPCGAVPPG